MEIKMNNKPQKIIVDYIPHGIDFTIFKPIDKTNKKYKKFIDEFYKSQYNNYNFILFYNNRNIKRKMPGDVILSYATFVRKLSKEKRNKILLVMHTHIVDEAGTDLKAVYNDLFSDVNILFSNRKYEEEFLNFIYNSVDVTINLANNEGYGLATAESLMTGTPIIATVTGGLQDQMGFEGVLNQEFFNEDKKPLCGN
jgi:glycosyltransferase involved in cell wall biosynthesis